MCTRQARLATAQEKDTAWLNTISTQDNAMEWGGFNIKEASTSRAEKKPASTYMFGSLIDAKASHPDSVDFTGVSPEVID